MSKVPARLNHVGISVADLDVASDFWIEGMAAEHHGAFGWPVGSAGADESLALVDTAAEVVLLRCDAAFMELFRFTSPGQGLRPDGSPGVTGLRWAVDDVEEARTRALRHGGRWADGQLVCPDGTLVELVAALDGPTGLVGVEVSVAEASAFAFTLDGPVVVQARSGAVGAPCSPVDLGANHVCLDVADADAARSGAVGVRWHHPVTESSGGIARVCYGTTRDGVLVELLESRSEQAFFSRARLRRGDG